MSIQGVWVTPGAAVNFRFGADIRRDLQEGPPNRNPNTVRGPTHGLMRLRAGHRARLPDVRRIILFSTIPHLSGDASILTS